MGMDTLKPGRGKRSNRKSGAAAANKARKHTEAEVRATEYSKLTNGQRLAKLDRDGFEAKRQRARITSNIAKGLV